MVNFLYQVEWAMGAQMKHCILVCLWECFEVKLVPEWYSVLPSMVGKRTKSREIPPFFPASLMQLEHPFLPPPALGQGFVMFGLLDSQAFNSH